MFHVSIGDLEGQCSGIETEQGALPWRQTRSGGSPAGCRPAPSTPPCCCAPASMQGAVLLPEHCLKAKAGTERFAKKHWHKQLIATGSLAGGHPAPCTLPCCCAPASGRQEVICQRPVALKVYSIIGVWHTMLQVSMRHALLLAAACLQHDMRMTFTDNPDR